MTRLRLFVFDGSAVIERTYSRFPVRIGRHPQNECQILDPRVSRFHAQFDYAAGTLVFRDVESQNGTVVLEGAAGRVLRGSEVRASDGRLAVLIGGVRVQARLEEHEGGELPDAFVPITREAARRLLDACPVQGEHAASHARGALASAQPVLDALFAGLIAVRLALHTEETGAQSYREPPMKRSETTSALLEWTQASAVALRLIEHALVASEDREELLLGEAIEAVDALLSELSPERLERETHDVCAEWPAARATAVLARYKEKHRGLVKRHARRPSVLLGKTFAGLYAQRPSERSLPVDVVLQSERRVRLQNEAFRATSSDTGEHPPPSSG
jgi:predicted component of type VI protein secretion system